MAQKDKPGIRKRQDYRRNKRPRMDRAPEVKVEWIPRTKLGKLVKEGKITDIEELFDKNIPIMEPEIINSLVPDLEEDLLLIGQAKGKFGGGQRRIFRQTQKKTAEGNKIHFMTCAVVGNRNGYVGVGTGKSKETVPAREKAKRKARLNLIRIRRGCGSWETDVREANSIPFAVEGKCGSVRITLMPAPRGKGLCIEKECAKILDLAGIKDIWSKTRGQTKTKLNLITALIDALKKLSEVKIKPEDVAKLSITEGRLKSSEPDQNKEFLEAVSGVGAEAVPAEVGIEVEAGTGAEAEANVSEVSETKKSVSEKEPEKERV